MQTGANSVEVCGVDDETLKSVDRKLVDCDNCCLNFGVIVVVLDSNEFCLSASGTFVDIDTVDDSCELTCCDKTVDGNITGISNDVVLLIGISDEKLVTEIIDGTMDSVVVNVERELIDFSDDKLNGNVSVDVMELIGSFDIIDNSIDFVENCDESVVDSEFTVLSINSSVNIVAFSSDVNWYVVSSVDMSSFSSCSVKLLKS